MRIPLPTDLKTRTGAPSDKDARQKNSYVETRGEEAIVRKRPSAQGGIPIGTGVAQGGIGLNINGTPYFIGFWADTMQPYTGGGTSWNAGTQYFQGMSVSNNFEDYYATPESEESPNINQTPSSSSPYWSRSYVPSVPRYTTTPSGGGVTVSLSETGTGSYPGPYVTTQICTIRRVSDNAILSTNTGIWTSTSYDAVLIPIPYFSFSNYVFTAGGAGTRRSNDIAIGLTVPSIPSGYDYYLYNASAVWNGVNYTGSGMFTPL